MKLEQFDITQIKDEYVTNIIPNLQGRVTQDELNKMLMILDDFCLALSANNILLIKIIGDQPINPLQPQEQPDMAPPIYEENLDAEPLTEPIEELDEFEEPVSKDNINLKEVYERKLKELEEQKRALDEIANAKPIKFTDRVRQMETANKKKIREEEDED